MKVERTSTRVHVASGNNKMDAERYSTPEAAPILHRRAI